MSNEQLADKPIITKFEKWKFVSWRQYLGCWSCRYVINKQN